MTGGKGVLSLHTTQQEILRLIFEPNHSLPFSHLCLAKQDEPQRPPFSHLNDLRHLGHLSIWIYLNDKLSGFKGTHVA